jgi:hypothetical protein
MVHREQCVNSHQVKQKQAFEKEGCVAELPHDHFFADDNSPCLAAPRHRRFIIFVFGHSVVAPPAHVSMETRPIEYFFAITYSPSTLVRASVQNMNINRPGVVPQISLPQFNFQPRSALHNRLQRQIGQRSPQHLDAQSLLSACYKYE